LSAASLSIVIPAYNEDLSIAKTLESLCAIEFLNPEVLIIVDTVQDSTCGAVDQALVKPNKTSVLIQNHGAGPANAIRYGLEKASGTCVVVMMADGSDDSRAIPELANLVQRGVSVACASRYMSGGQQIGGPRIKKFLSKSAGRILYHFAGVGTHDPTNSFKAYSKDFLSNVNLESSSGFEIGIELVAKAHRKSLAIAEVPTIWLDRSDGVSNFKLSRWIPHYLKWFFYCFGPKIKGEKR